MNGASQKALAVLMIIITTLGLLLSIFLLVQVWRLRQPVEAKLQSTLDKSAAILQTTDEGLVVLDQAISNIYTSTVYIDDATKAFSQTIQSSDRFIDTTSTFIGKDLITTITNTQTALESAQASAGVIDNILSTLSRIPFIGINYNPTVPLNQALGEVATSLDPIQGSIKDFQTNLETTQTNMRNFNEQISTLDKNILTINKNLRQARNTIDEYRTHIKSYTSSIDRAKTSLPGWINALAWIFTLIILWLVIIQIAIMLQGIMRLLPQRVYQEEINQQP